MYNPYALPAASSGVPRGHSSGVNHHSSHHHPSGAPPPPFRPLQPEPKLTKRQQRKIDKQSKKNAKKGAAVVPEVPSSSVVLPEVSPWEMADYEARHHDGAKTAPVSQWHHQRRCIAPSDLHGHGLLATQAAQVEAARLHGADLLHNTPADFHQHHAHEAHHHFTRRPDGRIHVVTHPAKDDDPHHHHDAHHHGGHHHHDAHHAPPPHHHHDAHHHGGHHHHDAHHAPPPHHHHHDGPPPIGYHVDAFPSSEAHGNWSVEIQDWFQLGAEEFIYDCGHAGEHLILDLSRPDGIRLGLEAEPPLPAVQFRISTSEGLVIAESHRMAVSAKEPVVLSGVICPREQVAAAISGSITGSRVVIITADGGGVRHKEWISLPRRGPRVFMETPVAHHHHVDGHHHHDAHHAPPPHHHHDAHHHGGHHHHDAHHAPPPHHHHHDAHHHGGHHHHDAHHAPPPHHHHDAHHHGGHHAPPPHHHQSVPPHHSAPHMQQRGASTAEVSHIQLGHHDTRLAEELLARLRRGENFATLARQYSTCDSAQDGGHLDPFGRGEMQPPFEEAAFTGPLNTPFGPIRTEQFGLHIMYVHRRW